LPVAIGLSHFSITGAFMGPLTMPHLPVNALTSSGAVVGVCLLPIVGLLLLCPKNEKTILFGTQFSFIRDHCVTVGVFCQAVGFR
jgi:hypothetical protein